jgi:hypothetical protein
MSFSHRRNFCVGSKLTGLTHARLVPSHPQPNVVHVHDMVETDDALYIVLEL